MAVPNKAVGYGNTLARNVFGLTFSAALSSAPKYESYDGGTYPAVGAGTTIVGIALAGKGAHTNPMPMLVDTSAAAPSATWASGIGAGTGGTANPNRLKGQTNFVTSAATSGGASAVRAYGVAYSKAAGALGNGTGAVDSATNPAGSITWNECFELPFEVVPSDNLTYDLLIRYTYTGGAPTLNWYFNDSGAGGTDATPVWTAVSPPTNGLRHCNAGTTAGTYLLDIPASNTVLASEGWIAP